jgi:hypothetical protein
MADECSESIFIEEESKDADLILATSPDGTLYYCTHILLFQPFKLPVN